MSRYVPRRVLRAILPRVTEELAMLLSGRMVQPPQWNRQEWQVAHAAAIIHGVSPLLAAQPCGAAPDAWRAFLETQRMQTEQRCRALQSLLATIDESARQVGIAFVALKGAALHAMEIYRPGERPMADLDLLLAPTDLPEMGRLLEPLGYHVVAVRGDEWMLAPVGRPRRAHLAEHAANGLAVELHGSISWPMPVAQVDITSSLWPAAPRPGGNGYPSIAALMLHLLQHAAVNMQVRLLRMIQLHDLALLGARMKLVDWQRVVESGQPHGSWWAAPPLRLLQRYYPDVVPDAVCVELERQCPRLLRLAARRARVSAVSASNSRKAMIPALAWSRSWSEARHCVTKRLARGARALGNGRGLGQGSELQPWITPSHRRRFFDVLRGRPRPETVMMVAAALADEFSAGGDQRQPNAA